jgi:CHAD domain-containing protein
LVKTEAGRARLTTIDRMKATLERELKLDVDPDFVLPDLGGKQLAPRTFTSTYFETSDQRLLRSGITIRRRVENRAGVWHLKLPSEAGRYELEERGGPSRPPDAFLGLLPALLRADAQLQPVAKLRTKRAGVVVGDRSNRVEVVLDTLAVLDGNRVASSFAEIEAEVVVGDGAALRGIDKALRSAGARRAQGAPKLSRVLAIDQPEQPPKSVDAATRLRDLLVAQYEAMLANDPGVRLGEDAEALHQLRVATRRSRALLRAARGLVAPEWSEPLRAELAWLGGLLGPVRDLDVLLDHLDAETASLGGADARAFKSLRAKLEQERLASRDLLLEAMSDQRYFRLLDTLERHDVASVTETAVSLPEIAGQAFARLRKAVKGLPKRPSDDELHRIRIQTKRARYAAELAEPVLGKAGIRFVRRAKTVQDVIGEHQDAAVADGRIRELAVGSGSRTALAAGRLVERQRLRKKAARRAFPGAWRALEKAGRTAF